MDNTQILAAMGVQVWVDRERQADEFAESVDSVDELNLSSLETLVEQCTRCPRHEFRQQVLFASGHDVRPLIQIVGLSPSKENDLSAEIISSPYKELLKAMLFAAGIESSSCYYTNVLKCFGGADKQASLEEITECIPYLRQQIKLVNPRVLLLLGHEVANVLLESDLHQESILHTRCEYESITGIVTHSLSALLNSPLLKKQAWQDIQLLKSLL